MTNKQMKELLGNFIGDSKLRRRVVREIVSDSENYNGDNMAERIQARLRDIGYGGCASGTVSSMIYYSDTKAFFAKYKDEILDLARDTADSIGESLMGFLGGLRNWDDSDPFCRETYNKNLMAWFAYEEIAYRLDSEIQASI